MTSGTENASSCVLPHSLTLWCLAKHICVCPQNIVNCKFESKNVILALNRRRSRGACEKGTGRSTALPLSSRTETRGYGTGNKRCVRPVKFGTGTGRVSGPCSSGLMRGVWAERLVLQRARRLEDTNRQCQSSCIVGVSSCLVGRTTQYTRR